MKITFEIDDKDEYGPEVYLNAPKMYDLLGQIKYWYHSETCADEPAYEKLYTYIDEWMCDNIDFTYDSYDHHIKKNNLKDKR